jgi:hypothetical protein
MPWKNVVGLDAAPVGHDLRAAGQHGCRVVGRRVVVGDRPAQRAARTHLRVADAAGQCGQRGQGGTHGRRLSATST